MGADRMREEFEAWADGDCFARDRMPCGTYVDSSTEIAWRAWQAARVAPAVQGEPVDWKDPAANWLREKAAAQQASNEQYPEHAKFYPAWENWVLKLNWLADELSAGDAPKTTERQHSLLDDNSLARQIGEIGNQIHNLGCGQQNDEELADRLADIANLLWKLQPSAMIQQPAPDVWKQAVYNVAGYAHLYGSGHGVIHEIRAEHTRLTAAHRKQGGES